MSTLINYLYISSNKPVQLFQAQGVTPVECIEQFKKFFQDGRQAGKWEFRTNSAGNYFNEVDHFWLPPVGNYYKNNQYTLNVLYTIEWKSNDDEM